MQKEVIQMSMFIQKYGEEICLDSFVVLDIETTGIRYTKDSIIEIAAVKYVNFEEVAVFETLVNPQIQIPRPISRLTGITQADVANAPTFESIKDNFLAFIGDHPLVGHNLIDFDVRFIQNAVQQPIFNTTIDTLDLSREVIPNLPNYKLSTLKDILHVDVGQSHRALADVRTTFAIFECCLYTMQHSCLPVDISDYELPSKSHQRVPQKPKYEHIKVSSIIPECNCPDPSSPLCGKNIVFTGTLSIPREEAMQRAVNAGAILKTGVSKKTHYLVVGLQDMDVVGADGMSSKEKKAHELNTSGKSNIQIITEQEFLNLLSKDGAIV